MDEVIEQTAETNESTEVGTEQVGVDSKADTTETEQGQETETEFTDGREDGESSETAEPQGETAAEPAETETETQEPPVKAWKTPENAEFARRKREMEAEAKIKKARLDAIKEVLGGVNPYTNEAMTDERDIAEYLTMKDIEKNGGDPIADYHKTVKAKEREQDRAKQTETERLEALRKDREDFTAKYPTIKVNDLLAEPLFRTFASGKLGNKPMTEIYGEYQTFIKLSEDKVKAKAAQIIANANVSTGGLSKEPPQARKPYMSMGNDEFERELEKVKRGEK